MDMSLATQLGGANGLRADNKVSNQTVRDHLQIPMANISWQSFWLTTKSKEKVSCPGFCILWAVMLQLPA